MFDLEKVDVGWSELERVKMVKLQLLLIDCGNNSFFLLSVNNLVSVKLWYFSDTMYLIETGNVVGCVLSLRSKEDVLQIWNKNSNNHADRIQICERFKWILHFGEGVIVQYKHNKLSIKDGSTFSNVRTFMVSASEQSNAYNSIDNETEQTPTTLEQK